MSFDAVEGREKGFNRFFVSFLRSRNGKLEMKSLAMRKCDGHGESEMNIRSKARLVNPIVDIGIGPVICPFYLISQVLREEVNALVFVRNYVVEFCVEHADDFAGLNADMRNLSIFLYKRLENVPHC